MELEFGYPAPPQLTKEMVEETRIRLVRTLVGINVIILAGAGLGGYYLAGRTLKPIEEMVEEQKLFITNASHDLRTPITAMRSSLEVALRDPKLKIAAARSYLQGNLEDVIRLQNLSESLLELSNNTDAKEFVRVKARDVIQGALKEVSPLAKLKKIMINAHIDDKAVFIGNLTMMQSALTAILDNAIKYSSAKTEIDISLITKKNRLFIIITDHGMGIKMSEIDQVTDRFYRSDMARSKDGYGLGLSIAQKIITAHKGELKITSKLKQGTTVEISLDDVS